MEYESRVKRPDSNSGLFLQEVVPTLGFHASTLHDVLTRGRADKLPETYRRSFFKPSSSSLSLAFFLALGRVTSSHLLPVRGAFLWSFPFSSRLTSDFASPAELPFLLFLFPRGLSPSLLSLSFLLFQPCSCFVFPLRCTSLPSAIVGVYSHSPSAIVPPQRCRNWSIGERCFGKAGRIEESRL